MTCYQQLIEMSNTVIKGIDPCSLVNIKNVSLDTSLPIKERMMEYFAQVKNPYCFLSGETPVKVSFSEEGKSLDEAVKDHFLKLKTL